MNKLAAFFHNKDVLNRVLFTLAIFFVFRIGSAITVPGVKVNESVWDNRYDAFSILNMMGGGALQNFSIFALGVSPYITSQIIVQLLSMDVLPALTQMTKEGETGRKKLDVVNRMLAVILAAIQAYGIIVALQNADGLTLVDSSAWGYVKIVIFMVAGSMMLNWMGDQITDKGIGNGISMMIFVGIISSLPSQLANAFDTFLKNNVNTGDPSLILQGAVQIFIYILAFVAIIIFVTFIEKSVRKLPVSHSNQSQAIEEESMQSSFLPIKVNASSVMPVIFASSIMVAPSIIISLFSNGNPPDWAKKIEEVFNYQALTTMGNVKFPWGTIIYAVLIIMFAYFYSQLEINPERIAENFQNSGTYITGVKPGTETQRYISRILYRITFMGSLALTFIALLPLILTLTGAVPQSLALGGTGLIIVVGVTLEVYNQINGIMAGNGYVESEL
ncbi:MAG: preprotein translocase subunit SecY [Candidatus Enterosoma sp.]|nr:preprotein translocase subunit SecY [Bacilli bacterium]MDD7607071.1 preprotein translocase subunit SecY [bacterium]MDY3907386.1 preprotein translocase subunit SecY [Candidatus Enterosoma sp.]MDY5649972.1 preprotein translocase subunit SecY [Candidatus Enterosoma sp.]MDY5865789.1 preprotein translocase subunit SecY [Candidatus Enterosoma sp.]